MPSSKPSDATLRLIVESYLRLTGKPLISNVPCDEDELREALWTAPRAIVAHGTEADPIFFYGNRWALELFEMSEEEFARLPSRLSAEPLAQEARLKLLEQVSQQGYVDGYSGMRIAKSGKRFMITEATVWDLLDEAGGFHGQAAVFIAGA
ncbi:MAG: MEKHLA domain protein [Gallionellaceae bacterium]|nr:MAG: MEKHLA domain protein [Gallionellaceae bacterium]